MSLGLCPVATLLISWSCDPTLTRLHFLPRSNLQSHPYSSEQTQSPSSHLDPRTSRTFTPLSPTLPRANEMAMVRWSRHFTARYSLSSKEITPSSRRESPRPSAGGVTPRRLPLFVCQSHRRGWSRGAATDTAGQTRDAARSSEVILGGPSLSSALLGGHVSFVHRTKSGDLTAEVLDWSRLNGVRRF